MAEDAPRPANVAAGSFLDSLSRRINLLRKDYPDLSQVTLDALFLAYLLETAQFGRFSYGPISIESGVVEARFAQAYPRGAFRPGYTADARRFYERLTREMERSGRKRIDELHCLLAFMRSPEGLPGEVFGELGVSPERVEAFARGERPAVDPGDPLLSPEEAAEYLKVHVQTVRAWIRSGKLRASRLAGQRSLRIRQSDLGSVLEPVDPSDFE
jgi:excisionase family DNA binding protein